MHMNTKWLMEWATRMHKKFDHPPTGVDWCRKLAYAVGEAGNERPSSYAIDVAKRWELMTIWEIENEVL